MASVQSSADDDNPHELEGASGGAACSLQLQTTPCGQGHSACHCAMVGLFRGDLLYIAVSANKRGSVSFF
jgi:hypothetical protein